MLRHLHISNLALIDDISLDVSPGMTAMTGETGAGKSIVLDAMGLLAGTRATPSLVRSGAKRAAAEAVFDVPGESAVALLLKELGLEPEEPGEVILRREVLAAGRSRASINGRLVPLSQLQRVAAELIEICGQHDQQTLLHPSVQRNFFDTFAGLEAERKQVEAAYRRVLKARAALDALAQEDREREQRRDFLCFQVEELEALALQPGELAALEGECRRLEHTDELVRSGEEALALLCEGPESGESALDKAGQAIRAVKEMAAHDEALKPLLENLVEAQTQIEDSGYELRRYVANQEQDPGRLDEINARADAVKRALRKHGPDEQAALDQLAAMQEELQRLENYDSEKREAEKELRAALEALEKAAHELSRQRHRAQKDFTRPLQALLRDFSMPKARVEVSFPPLSQGVPLTDGETLCGAEGLEEVEILFSANAGEKLQPLRQVASGGELSRMMLALRTLNAERDATPLLIFDEVDAGISGAAARRVAERMAALGQRHQVLCVTHNPSIASAAQNHLIVSKEEKKGRTETNVAEARGKTRKEELARLLDGGQLSQKGLALAGELLKKAG